MVNINELKAYLDTAGYAYDCDVPMKGYTTFKIGGPTPLLIRATDLVQIKGFVSKCNELRIPITVIGKGSNLLVKDSGIDTTVLYMGEEFTGMEINGCEITCESGVTLTRLCRFAMENSLSGLEFAFGIPGTLGGAVYMNAGAYGGEMKDVVTRTTHIDSKGNEGSCTAEQLNFSYRHSCYTDGDKIITGATMLLKKGDRDEIRRVMEETMQKRIDKQPLEYPSAGSTFKRPQGNFASALIDRCGLKGLRVGGAMVSEKHAGFVINYNNATCDDVMGVISKVKEIVNDKTGYNLECEIKML